MITVLILLALGITPFASADPTRRRLSGNSGHHTPNSTYHANLELLSATLQKNASSSPFLFAKGSVGVGPDKAYGFALCRGDIDVSSCTACIATVFQTLLPMFKFGTLSYYYTDKCISCYSNLDFLEFANSSEVDGFYYQKNPQNIPGWDPSDADIINVLLQETANMAAYNTTGRFATCLMDVRSTFPVLFSTAQCTPDLTPKDCWACLKNISDMAMDKIGGRQGGRVFLLRCNLRYEAFQFYSGQPMRHIFYSGVAVPAVVASQKHKILIIAVVVPLLALFICVVVSFGFIRRKRKGTGSTDKGKMNVKEDETLVWALDGRSSEFTVYDLSQVLEATCNFSDENKLGQGGFGPVYKGHFDGLEIAVKRLASHSGQGFTEFKNEIQLIARLQHTNLVRLLGCCSQGDEKILIYEYLPNKSLDFFIFDESRRALLDWMKRLLIIDGIAQGLLYLHKHSRLRVIHRDLKAGNILLDHEMNPKISDFGLAKIFSTKDTEGNTKRIVGTYGYMAPEYASEGIFSIKSDVFSFGVLVLEIVGGKRTSSFHGYGDFINLLGHAWQLWKDERWLELVDTSLLAECHTLEMMRCINIALLCVQGNAADRPTMSDVVAMLNSESMTLPMPEPKHPAYFHVRVTEEEVSTVAEPSSVNDVTISDLRGR